MPADFCLAGQKIHSPIHTRRDFKQALRIDFERCKECGYCIKFCPKGVLSKGSHVNKKGYYPPVAGEGCIACGTCARVCPDTAISVYKDA
ncbi:MAG: ferredoxin family protein [Oscillibacter sp.]|nr:ferredoxin family protein [Oscillibacter sp.]